MKTIAQEWADYSALAGTAASAEVLEKFRQVFYDGFSMALMAWSEAEGSADAFCALREEFVAASSLLDFDSAGHS